MVNFLCENCFTISKYIKTSKNKFCSNKCQWDYEWKIRKNTIKWLKRASGAKEARRFLLDIEGHICKICKLTEWQSKPIPLVCDHIDGNSENWILDNLRMICCNCDALTITYKSKNKGKGRHSRRERYKQDKSY